MASETNNAERNDLVIDNLPNRITIFRMALIPIVVGSLYLEGFDWDLITNWKGTLGWIAGWTFVLAGITDFVDGYIARKNGIVTVFGSFLDPIADKFLIASSLIMLEYLGRISALVVLVLILREIYMTSLRLLAQNEGLHVPVNDLGKWKTATQLVGIPFIMANGSFLGISMFYLGSTLVYASTILSIYSAAIYSINLVKKLKTDRASKKRIKNES